MSNETEYEIIEVRQPGLSGLEKLAEQHGDDFKLLEKVVRIKPDSNPAKRNVGIPMKEPVPANLKLAVMMLNPTDLEAAESEAVQLIVKAKSHEIRTTLRNGAMAVLEGPEKAILKAVKNCMENLGMEEDEARNFVIDQRKKKGLPV